MKKIMSLVLLAVGLYSCESNWLPRPPGYNRIDLPKHSYQKLEQGYPYQLDFSTYSRVEADSFNLNEKEWINLNYPDFGAKVHLTYKKIDQNTDFKILSNDAFNLSGARYRSVPPAVTEFVLVRCKKFRLRLAKPKSASLHTV